MGKKLGELRTLKKILTNERTIRVLIVPNFKLDYKATVIKKVYFNNKNQHDIKKHFD